MSNDLFLKRCVSSGSLCVSLSVSCDLFVFVLEGFFLKLSLVQILALVLSFYHFEGSFRFWAHLWGLVLRLFSNCSSLMSFSPFHVSCDFFLFWLLLLLFFSVLSRTSYGSVLLCATFFFFSFFPGPYSTQLFLLLVLFTAVFRAWIHPLLSFVS